jgi:hypothetical protein
MEGRELFGWIILALAAAGAFFLWQQRGSAGASASDIADATKAWVHQPFNSTMSLGWWFLFVGVLAASATLWARVLDHIGE